jgi:hypothetical protein
LSGWLSSSLGTQFLSDSWSLLLVHSEGLFEQDDSGKGKAAAMLQKGQISGG